MGCILCQGCPTAATRDRRQHRLLCVESAVSKFPEIVDLRFLVPEFSFNPPPHVFRLCGPCLCQRKLPERSGNKRCLLKRGNPTCGKIELRMNRKELSTFHPTVADVCVLDQMIVIRVRGKTELHRFLHL